MEDTARFLDEAAALLGPRGWTQDPDLVEPWLTDWRGRYHGRTLALASPASTEEVSALVRLCAKHGVAIVPQGGNSGMSGGATPDESGSQLLLSLRRMNSLRKLDAEGRQAVCDAGLILENLHNAAEDAGLRFPLTLGGKGSATIGGLVSTNAGGTQVIRHGSMRSLVLGIEAVLADGSIFDALTPLKKDNRGFDLKQLLIGSEGTLGIVTAATLRLVPALADRIVVWAGVPDLHVARSLLLHCENLVGDSLEGFEVLQSTSLHAVLDHLPDARAPLQGEHAWHVLVEVVAQRGDEEGLQERVEAMVASAFEAGLVEDAVLSANEAQARAFWLIRDSIAPAERAKGAAVQHDVSVPVERMPTFVHHAVPLVQTEFPGTHALAFGHLGDGNVHFHVLAPTGMSQREYDSDIGPRVSARVHDLVTEYGGSISAEHGIGRSKRAELERLGDPVSLAMMRRVKKALDPAGILNPGKLVALAQEPASA